MFPQMAGAQSHGMKFDQIAVGTQFYYEGYGGGVSWMEHYDGIRNGLHEMRHYFVGSGKARLFRVTRYDSVGRVAEIEKPKFGLLIRFEPYHCDRSGARKYAHRRIVIDTKTGKTKSAYIRKFETRLQGRTLHIIRNAETNRLKSRIKLDDRNVATDMRDSAIGKNAGSRLIKVAVP